MGALKPTGSGFFMIAMSFSMDDVDTSVWSNSLHRSAMNSSDGNRCLLLLIHWSMILNRIEADLFFGIVYSKLQ
jgi:hypothetical protein